MNWEKLCPNLIFIVENMIIYVHLWKKYVFALETREFLAHSKFRIYHILSLENTLNVYNN